MPYRASPMRDNFGCIGQAGTSSIPCAILTDLAFDSNQEAGVVWGMTRKLANSILSFEDRESMRQWFSKRLVKNV